MWYSSQIHLANKERSTNYQDAYEQASKPREMLVHKARNSELQTRKINNSIANFFEDDNTTHQSQEIQNTKKTSKIFLFIVITTIVIMGISGQHLFPEKLTSFSEVLKLINVEAFESYEKKTISVNEKNPVIIENSQPDQISLNKATPNAKYSRSLVLLDLEDWRKNWSSRNLKNFMTYYHPEFPGLKLFKNNKRRIFKKTKYIKISLKNIISRVDGNNIITSFTQIYKSKNYNDNSIKELRWAKTKLGWKIIEEKNINSDVAKQGKK
jgi:hypothetical protein